MHFLPRTVKTFNRSRPNLAVSLVTQNSRRINEWVATGSVDLGVAQWPVEDPAIESERIRLACVCAMPLKHPLAVKKFVTPRDLSGAPFIATIPADLTYFRVRQAFAEAGVRFRVQFECRYFAVACALVAEELGVSVVDPFTARDFLGRGVVSRPMRPEIPFEMGILYPHHASTLAREFAALIKSSVEGLAAA